MPLSSKKATVCSWIRLSLDKASFGTNGMLQPPPPGSKPQARRAGRYSVCAVIATKAGARWLLKLSRVIFLISVRRFGVTVRKTF